MSLPKSDRICHKATRLPSPLQAGSSSRLRALPAVLRKSAPKTRTGATNRPRPGRRRRLRRQTYGFLPAGTILRHGQCTGLGDPPRCARQRPRHPVAARCGGCIGPSPDRSTGNAELFGGAGRRCEFRGFATDELQRVSVRTPLPSACEAHGLAFELACPYGRKRLLRRGVVAFPRRCSPNLPDLRPPWPRGLYGNARCAVRVFVSAARARSARPLLLSRLLHIRYCGSTAQGCQPLRNGAVTAVD